MSLLLCYVVGLGHTGSTLLDLSLSAHPQVTGVGEAKKLRLYMEDRPSGTGHDSRRCSCGIDPVTDCPFWLAVDAQLARDGRRLRELDLQSTDDSVFAADNRAFFDAVAAVTGSSVVVDSSKSAVRLQRLVGLTGLVVVPVHLVRSTFGTVASYKRRGHDLPRAASLYARFTWAAMRAAPSVPRATISLEALASEPEAVLSRLMRCLDLGLHPDQLAWSGTDHHQIGGNGMRFTTSSAFHRPDDGRDDLSVAERAVLTATCRPIEALARARERRFMAQVSPERVR
jgi:hypothetical protein